MARKQLLIALVAGIILGAPGKGIAQTQKAIDPTLFADSIGLNKLLQLQGIDPANVKWGSIDPLCMGLKTDDNDIAFNKCRYEKIILKRTHGVQAMPGPVDPALFADAIGLNKLLQMQDIDPARVDWGSIDPICMGLKTDDDDTAFNRCRYEKLILQRQFARDSHACTRRADKPGNTVTTQTYTVTDTADSTRVVQEVSQPTTFNGCMQRLGWADPRDWTAGLVTTPVAP